MNRREGKERTRDEWIPAADGCFDQKEFLQLSRDSSSLLLGIVLPIALILIIGYGISLDIRDISTAVVLEDPSPKAQDAVSFLNGSRYFSPTYVTSFKEAEALLLDRKASVIIDIPPDFTSRLSQGRAKSLSLSMGWKQPRP